MLPVRAARLRPRDPAAELCRGISPIDSPRPTNDTRCGGVTADGPEFPVGSAATPTALPVADEIEVIMERKVSALSERYLMALRRYLRQGSAASLQQARGLGRRAVALALETLDMARIHEGAMAAIGAATPRRENIRRATVFFTEVVTPIERTHPAAVQAEAHVKEMGQALRRRTMDLAASLRSLKQSIVCRKIAEESLARSGSHSEQLLAESCRLQAHLRQLARLHLTAREGKREQISHGLQDEIAQTLLGINVRLVALKREGALQARDFQKEVAKTKRLVDTSVRCIERFANHLDHHAEA